MKYNVFTGNGSLFWIILEKASETLNQLMFTFPVGEDFSFTYSDGHTVGFDKNAKVIEEFKN